MHYLALGDSISIDEYPFRETGKRGIGAVSLFHRDLQKIYPGLTFEDLTADGATSEDVLRWQLPRAKGTDDEAIVTITAGGNDMLMNLRSPRPPADLVAAMIKRLERIVAEVLARFSGARILLGTVYDPSDGTNVLYGEKLDREAGWLAEFNDAIRRIPNSDPRITLIDIHKHFLGHGLSAPENDRWYWSGLIFEPNARGAEEVRRLWLDAVGEKQRAG
jgi:lysophospholipase L1-like esterase